MSALLLIHLAATLAMNGIIWFVQLVHYPLLSHAERSTFPAFAAAYQRRTTWVVLPLMAAELATAALIVRYAPPALRSLSIWGLALLGIIWLSTALLQVPRHRRLAERFEPTVHRGLVRANWIRTVAWTTRSAIALALVAG